MVTTSLVPSASLTGVRRILAMVTVLPRGGGAERDDGRWFDQGAFAFEPDLATLDLVVVGPLVQAPFAAHLVLEVLDRVGDESVVPGNAGVFKRGIENAAGRPDERLSRQILLVAGLFADQHEIDRRRTFARHHLGGVAVKWATSALALGRRQRAQRFDGFATFLVHVLIHGGRMPNRGKRFEGRHKGIFMSLLPSRRSPAKA